MTREESDAHQGRIVHIEVENFKSYRGHQKIGPFYDFTAVVGANGSGKSNLMDAISFVLGVKTAQLRGSLKELLFSGTPGSRPAERSRKAYVKLVFEDPDGDEVHFMRGIVPSGASADAAYQSQYKINDKTVTWDAYNNKLKSYNILVQARNFLVFQGDIESVAALSPKDLSNLIEQISGSAASKKEYIELEAKKTEADERTSFVFTKKKAVAAEKRQKKEQKEEAERHIKLQQDLEALKAEHYLWQLYQIEKDTSSAREQCAKHKEDLKETAKLLHASEKAVEEKKQAAAGINKERMLLERKFKKRKGDLDKKSPDSAKNKEELSRLYKRLRAGRKSVEEKQKKCLEQKEKVAKLDKDLESITDAQAQLEAEMKKAAEEGQVHLDAQLQAEFYKIQEEAKSKTSRLRADHDSLSTAQDANKEALGSMEEKASGVSQRMQQLEADQASFTQQAEKLRTDLAAAKKELASKKATHSAKQDELRKAGAQRDYLTQKREQVEEKLREAKAGRTESQRDRQMKEAVGKLKHLFPGVYGRVTELSKVSQRKYYLAMALVLGRDLDSIIVDTNKTAQECIRWLRENHVPPMTFFPLDIVRAKPVNERLRSLGGTAKVAIDLLEYDKSLERAFITLCGATLVCDSVAEAKRLAFMGPERHKVVTVDGTLIAKSGFITGGSAGNEAARASRWDDKALEALKKERANLDEQLNNLRSERDSGQAELSSAIAGLEHDVQYKTAELKGVEQKLAAAAGEAAALREETHNKLPGADKLRKAIAEREAKMEKVQTRINEIEDRIFAAFSVKVGVDNIREYMEQNAAATEDFTKRRMSLTSQASKLKHQLTYERKRDLQAEVTAAQTELQQIEQHLQQLEEQARTASAAAERIEQELAAQVKSIEELKAKGDAAEGEVRAAKKDAAKHQADGNAVRRALSAHEAALEALAAKRADVLEAANMEQVALPRKGDRVKTARGDDDSEDEDDDEDMEDADDEGDEGEEKAAEKFKLDFSGLKRQHMAARSEKDRAALDAEFRREIEARSSALAHVAPNLKALDQFQAVKAREREQEEELEAARRDAKAAAKAFNDVRQKRYDAFTKAFEHIASVIDPIFKDLTKSSVNPTGGTAYLSLENTDEPFLHGIKFTAMPPTKRFRDMEQLSGGEKTVAALALLFAIHSYQPSPFFVLDEIDAALDATNVARVAEYIRSKTRPSAEHRFQSIVISLKDNFYEKADALVGVARDVDRCCSATYTFDLTRFAAG